MEQPHSQAPPFPGSLAATCGRVWTGGEQRRVLALRLVLPPLHGAEVQVQPWGRAESEMEVTWALSHFLGPIAPHSQTSS